MDYTVIPELEYGFVEFYRADIHGISSCEENDVELIYGSFCNEDEILITDYTADGLITNLSKYTDYASIIKTEY